MMRCRVFWVLQPCLLISLCCSFTTNTLTCPFLSLSKCDLDAFTHVHRCTTSNNIHHYRMQMGINLAEGHRLPQGEMCRKENVMTRRTAAEASPNQNPALNIFDEGFSLIRTATASVILATMLVFSSGMGAAFADADDTLAQFAAEGNKVGVDGACFMNKCSLQTKNCMNDPNCLKGLTCLAKCKGDSLCSTGCFAKYGNPALDEVLYCSVEKEDCVHVPRDETRATWESPAEEDHPKVVSNFNMASLKGKWYKSMGMDSRYDCFDCQYNTFALDDAKNTKNPKKLVAEISFRMPRQKAPGYSETKVLEELMGEDDPKATRSMHSMGKMFGLTFWENWYVIGQSEEGDSLPYKFIYYTGHTLQGNYKGAFVYTRTPEISPELFPAIKEDAVRAGLDPDSFCKIRNACFSEQPANEKLANEKIRNEMTLTSRNKKDPRPPALPTGFIGTDFFRSSRAIAEELADWFEDPTILSDWLLEQQEKMILNEPMEVSPFGSTPLGGRRPQS